MGSPHTHTHTHTSTKKQSTTNLNLGVNLFEHLVQSSDRAGDAQEQCLLLLFMRIYSIGSYATRRSTRHAGTGEKDSEDEQRLLCIVTGKEKKALC